MTDKRGNLAIWWIRRDLRVEDNQALTQALKKFSRVVPVVILDPDLIHSRMMGGDRLAFYYGGLRAMEKKIRQKGGRLVVRTGSPLAQLTELIEETGAQRIFAEQDFTPYAQRRDKAVQRKLPLQLTPGLTLAHPDQIQTNAGGPYQVYSYYRDKWKREIFEAGLPPREKLPERPFEKGKWTTEAVPGPPEEGAENSWVPGEDQARTLLDQFVRGEDPPIYRYQDSRDRPDLDGTSRLSPYLHLGMLSIREAAAAAQQTVETAPDQAGYQSAETWLEQLIWREFMISILYHFPRVLGESFREPYSSIAWRNNPEEFRRWKEGTTGYPLVDTGMRQLLADQWMHNRLRMVTASFLVKDLLIDWRWGEEWFQKNLLDADLAANNGGWQWVAGTGTDAAPYFRVFNPTTQAEKHDPAGDFIRRYLPELRRVPDEYIHAPWKMPEKLQEEVDCVIGRDYPAPLVEHGKARERALEVYQLAREEAERG